MTDPLIVCVDDDPEVARTLARTLKRENLKPMSTTEPEEALEWVLENDVAVLLSDFEMPTMNGIELSAHVKRLRPTTVRILMTAHVTADTAVRGINTGGVFRFVPKPFDLGQLATIVHEGVDHHKELAAVAHERDHVVRRERIMTNLENKFPALTTPSRALDGAYVVRRTTTEAVAGLGLDALLALRHRAK